MSWECLNRVALNMGYVGIPLNRHGSPFIQVPLFHLSDPRRRQIVHTLPWPME